jgi:L-asparaginase
VLDFMLNSHDALILECFGAGGLPAFADTQVHFDAINRAVNSDKTIVVTTQVQNEGSDLSVYKVGDALRAHPRILEARDMTTEAALCKLMWILPQTNNAEKISKLFNTQIAHDVIITDM